MKRDAIPYVDFAHVPEQQQAMHGRLENWGRSCNGKAASNTAPMFRQFRSSQTWASSYCQETRQPVDRADAVKIARGVAFLPTWHRMALQWYYVQHTSVLSARKAIGCTTEMLAVYVTDARAMLINRGV